MTLSRPWWTPFCWERGESGRQEKSGGASALPRRAHTYETEMERERERKNKEREVELTRRRVPLLMVLCSWSSARGPLLLGATHGPLLPPEKVNTYLLLLGAAHGPLLLGATRGPLLPPEKVNTYLLLMVPFCLSYAAVLIKFLSLLCFF
jgi:hypothetical protein